MNKKKKELLDQLEQKNNRVNEIIVAVGEDEFNAEQKQELDRLEKEMGEVEGELEPYLKRDENARQAKERTEAIKRNRMPISGKAAADVTEQISNTLGAKFAQSDEYKSWIKGIAPNGRVPERTNLQSPTTQFKGLVHALRVKTLVTSDPTSGGALVDDIRLSTPVIEGLMRELTISDLVTTIPVTNGDAIEYAQMTSFTNNAATVPEANVTNYTGAPGEIEGRKPESGLGMRVVKDYVRTIAHWMAETTKILMDAPQLEGLIEAFLLYGLRAKRETLIVSGAGEGEDFTGILNTQGIQKQTFDTDILRTLRRARTKIKTPGRVQPSAYLMNPLDWEKVDLLTDGEDRFYFGGPTNMGNPRVWGLPVVESEAVPEGTAIVAAWRFAVLYDRMQGTISASNSHADFFIRNLVAILAECREGFGIHYVKAFCEIDLTAAA